HIHDPMLCSDHPLSSLLLHPPPTSRHTLSLHDALPISLTTVKQSYTRVQAGATLGGPLQKDKTFYFFSYETIRAQTSGFTSIGEDRKSTRLNSSHQIISYAVFCLKKKNEASADESNSYQ